MSTTSKNNILKKIRLALTHSTPIPFPQSEGTSPVVQPLQQDIVVEFAEQFTNLQGKFQFCTDASELHHNLAVLVTQHEWTKVYCEDEQWKSLVQERVWTDDIVTCDASITSCELLVARTGSIILSSKNSGRITSVYAPVHICIAFTSQLVYDIKDGLVQLKQKYKGKLPSFITLATGPSRTADIEKTLVVGVHGPKEVYVFLVDDIS
ncbi:LutC/YkgG family protein [Flavisolibacter tropicus]|uniref:Lactate utilization protein B/C n=1 Tax=Flavisolibacter tropicus TaxID=1492898 RepID=A0A172TYQ9_9BACT|nr:LUD domain-containing protein [Flavisolibacter tropicus]ANE52241.1 lactate utilization protein B/C [Flavisolibacter tropicus]